MKKLLIFLLLLTNVVLAQKQPYAPYRTNGSTMPKDSSLAVGYLLIPTFTSPSIIGYADRWGSNFGLNRTNSRLSVRGPGSFVEFPNATEVALLSGSYANPSWITSLAWSKISGAPSFITAETDPLYVANGVPKTRTINGYDLNANRVLTTTDISEGTNLYATNARSLLYTLTGYLVGSNTALASSDTYLGAFQKIQGQINAIAGSGVTSIIGTANQVNRSSATGAVTLSLPQDIALTSAPTFRQLFLDFASGNDRILGFRTGGLSRWLLLANSTGESGSNIGSDFEIKRRADDGSNIGSVLTITRSTGNAIWSNNVTAASFIRNGGTSSQFLKADGSVDATAYTSNLGTVTNFSKTDGIGISSSISNSSITPNHTIAVDTMVIRTAANSRTLAQTQAAFNLKQNTVSLTTIGTGGVSTFNSSTGVLNIPNYATSSGTVTSLTPGVGFTSATPITVSGTLNIDTASTIASKVWVSNRSYTKAEVNAKIYGGGGAVESGIYTPTVSVAYNITSSTSNQFTYTRVGDVVTVFGKIGIQPTSTGTAEFDITIPYGTILYNSDLNGNGSTQSDMGTGVHVTGNSSGNKARVQVTITNAALGRDLFISFQYLHSNV